MLRENNKENKMFEIKKNVEEMAITKKIEEVKLFIISFFEFIIFKIVSKWKAIKKLKGIIIIVERINIFLIMNLIFSTFPLIQSLDNSGKAAEIIIEGKKEIIVEIIWEK